MKAKKSIFVHPLKFLILVRPDSCKLLVMLIVDSAGFMQPDAKSDIHIGHYLLRPQDKASASLQYERVKSPPLAVGMNGAAFNVNGSLENIQVVALQEFASGMIILVPAGHHGR